MSGFATTAIVFDFDGVLVESTDVKTSAFAAIYRRHGESIAAQATAYHVANAGISRLVKFRHLHRTLLGRELSDAEIGALGAEFSRLVVEAVVAAPWVAGALEFLEAHRSGPALFIASGTPEDELKMIAARRGMLGYFRSIHGSPASKGEILAAILKRHGFEAGRVLMVGDALADLDGARQAGTRFVGRAHHTSHPFPPDVPTLRDLAGLVDHL